MHMKTRLRQWKIDRTTPLWNQFTATRNMYHRTIKDTKRQHWDTFLNEARGKEIFTALKYTKPRKTEPTPDITYDSETATTFQEKANLFRQSMFPPPPVANLGDLDALHGHTLQWPPISPEEIRKAIKTSAPMKAPGPDSLGFNCISIAYDTIPDHFNSLFRALFHAGHHPTCTTTAKEKTTANFPPSPFLIG